MSKNVQEPKECAVVVSTCDMYSDIWEPFFSLFYKYWPDNPYHVFLNSETLEFTNKKAAITTLKAYTAGISWTRRLKEALDRIETEYIIFMLDDFFLYDFVDTQCIKKYLSYMQDNYSIAAIYISPLIHQMENSCLPGLEKCKHDSNSKINLTLALWRRSSFLSYLNHEESIWEFEVNSLGRSLSNNDEFYSTSKNIRMAIPYNFGKYGLFAGKWFKPTVELFEANAISYDFSVRGFYEEYEFGLIPYVANQIKMDSYLVPYHALKNDNPRITTDSIINEGYFTQIYEVSPGAKNVAMWHLSTMHGFGVEDFKCTITFKSGIKETLQANDVFGNFSLYQNIMYFLNWGPFVYIFTESKQEISAVSFEGFLNKNLDKEDLATAYNMNLRIVPTGLSSLLDASRIYAELLLVPERFSTFRIFSKLCFKLGKNYTEENEVYNGKDWFPGDFSQTYTIEQSIEPVVRWDIDESAVGFAITNMRVELLFSNGNIYTLKEKALKKGNFIYVNGYRVFLSSPAHLFIKLPKILPDKIRISGNISAPMPKEILDFVVNKNISRFTLSIVKRGLKRYGAIGVIKEVVKRFISNKS